MGYRINVRLNFRKKILISYIAFFLAFASLLYPIFFGLSQRAISDLELAAKLAMTFYFISILLILLFGLFALFVVHYLTRPIKDIITAIKEKGWVEIPLEKEIKRKDEFGLLAETLNALSRKVQSQIQSLLHEKNEKAAILESLGEGVIAVDRDLNVTYINHMAELFLDIDKTELLGKNFAFSKQKKCLNLIEQAQKKRETVVSLIKKEKKPKKWFDVIAVPRKEGGAILVLQDKTGLHRVLEKGRDFIANASHELKTPITIIRGFAETLHDHPELTKEVSQDITKKIVSNCYRMDTLVKNLLTLAALDEGIPDSRRHECDLYDLAERAKQTILTIHPEAKITIIEKGEGQILQADNDLLFQAILNLLDNAAKYSKPPADITISIEQKGEEILLSVSDKGMGIPQEELELIFDRFYAVDKSHSRSLGGSGLGLSIVESIIEKHKGKITVVSEEGKGTTFTLHFPAT